MWLKNNGNGNSIATIEMVQKKLDAALNLIEKLEFYVNRLEKLNVQSEGKENETIIAWTQNAFTGEQNACK